MKLFTPICSGAMLLAFVGCESPKPKGDGTGIEGAKPPKATNCPAQTSAREFPEFTAGEIVRINRTAMEQLIAPGTRIEMLAGPGSAYRALDGSAARLPEGFTWAEGPVWVSQHRWLLFSDIHPNRVYKWSATEGLSLFLTPSGYTGASPRGGEVGSNGLIIDPEYGRLILCQHGDRRVAVLKNNLRQPHPPEYTTLAGRYQGKRFNSPNDGCFNKNFDLYFTDPPYGLEKRMQDPAKELDFQGVYLRRHNGELVLLTREVTRPNGIALSPDEKWLYVAVSDREHTHIKRFPVKADGTLGGGAEFFNAHPFVAEEKARRGITTWPGSCDGLKVDIHGNLFATGPPGVMILSPEGKHIGTLRTNERTANCAWGDDGCTLYITADMYLLRVRTRTKGAGF